MPWEGGRGGHTTPLFTFHASYTHRILTHTLEVPGHFAVGERQKGAHPEDEMRANGESSAVLNHQEFGEAEQTKRRCDVFLMRNGPQWVMDATREVGVRTGESGEGDLKIIAG